MTEFPEPATVDSTLIVRSDHACFGCGDNNPIGLRLGFAFSGNGVEASFIPSAAHQGFHDVVHGGIISTVIDEAMAWATAHAGVRAVTGKMRVRFRQPLRIDEPTIVAARVVATRGRLVTTAAELVRERDRSPIATASASFLKVDAATEAADGLGTCKTQKRRHPSCVKFRRIRPKAELSDIGVVRQVTMFSIVTLSTQERNRGTTRY